MSSLVDQLSKKFGVPADRIIVSKTLLCRVLGVDSKTVDKWARETPPLPVLVRGQQKPNRIEWVYDLKAVVIWREETAYARGLREGGAGVSAARTMIDPKTGEAVEVPDHMIPTEEAKRREAIVDWKDKQLDFDIKQRNVLDFDQAEAVVGDVCSRISERLGLMRSEVTATLKRAGIDEVASAEMVDDHIFEMIAMLANVDVSVDPIDADDDEDGHGSGEDEDPEAS